MFRITAINRASGKIIEMESISNGDSEVDVWYPAELVGSIDILRDALKKWPESYIKDAIYGYITKGGFNIHCEACHCPNIGDVEVIVETRIMNMTIDEWNNLPKER
jgi:hypothetical protein